MTALFVVAILVMSSLAAAVVAHWAFGVSAACLPAAARRMFEFLGLWLVCFALNAALGIAVVLAIRTHTAQFVSVYVVNDLSLMIFSAIQASILHAWLVSSAANRPAVKASGKSPRCPS